MKIFISADMEGISTVVSMGQVDPGSKVYERARKQMIREVNDVIEAAFENGAKEIVVNDSHYNMANILIEELDSRATLNKREPKTVEHDAGNR